MAKVEAELDAAGLLKTAANPAPRPFTYADIGKLHYLDCCIKVCDVRRGPLSISIPIMGFGVLAESYKACTHASICTARL